MASKTDIANLAIAHLGTGKLIGNVDSDTTAEARACRQNYDQARQELLVIYDYRFATRNIDLTKVADNPTTEWLVSHRYPPGVLKVRRIVDGTRSTLLPPIPFTIAQDDTWKLILSNTDPLTVEVTMDEQRVEIFPPHFVSALSTLLASKIVPRLSKGDLAKRQQFALQLYKMAEGLARQGDANEQQEQIMASDLERARA